MVLGWRPLNLFKDGKTLGWLQGQLGPHCPSGVSFDNWPSFRWEIQALRPGWKLPAEQGSLFLSANSDFIDPLNLAAFLMGFIYKFRPKDSYCTCAVHVEERSDPSFSAAGWMLACSRKTFLLEDIWDRTLALHDIVKEK